jgi:hypothetical protein
MTTPIDSNEFVFVCARQASATVAAALALAFAPLTPVALATEPLSGYGSKPSGAEAPTTTTPQPAAPPTPSQAAPPPATQEGTSPSGEEAPKPQIETPRGNERHASARAAKLPFTGFDLRYGVGLAVVLIGAGCMILRAQRRGQG